MDPDRFCGDVQALCRARGQIIEAADRADFAARRAGTSIRTTLLRAQIEMISAEISRIEQQVMAAASTEFAERQSSGPQELVCRIAGIRRINRVEFRGDDESLSAMELRLQVGIIGGQRTVPGQRNLLGQSSLHAALRDNLLKGRGFDRRGFSLGFALLSMAAAKAKAKQPLVRSSSLSLVPPDQLALTTDVSVVSDAELAWLSVDELDGLIRQILKSSNDSQMSKAELKLALPIAAVADPKGPELHLAAIAAEQVNTLRALADHVGFAHDLRDLAKSMSTAQLEALSSQSLTGLLGVLVRAGDDGEITDTDRGQIQRVLGAFNNTTRLSGDALRLVETAIGAKLIEALGAASIDLDGYRFEEHELGSEVRKLVGCASFAPKFSNSTLASLIESGDREIAGFLFKSGVAYSPEILKIGFERFITNKESFDETAQNFLILEPPGLRVLDALASNPAAASLILFANRASDQAWLEYKNWLDGPDRLSQRRYWNSNAPKSGQWDIRGSADKETDLIAALFLRAATNGYATQHAANGQGRYLFDILKHAFNEQNSYKLTDGARVALASLLNDTMRHPEHANGYFVTLATDSVTTPLGGMTGSELTQFIEVLAKSDRAAHEIIAGFGGLLNQIDLVAPREDFWNARKAGEAFRRVANSLNDGIKARSDEQRAEAEKFALIATVFASLATGGLGAVGSSAVRGVVWAGVGDGLMSYISGIPSDSFKSMSVNALVTFELQRRILESSTPGIVELRKDPLVAKYLRKDGSVNVPEPSKLKEMMDQINGAFYRIDLNSEGSLYPGPVAVLEKALEGWEKALIK